MKIENKHLAVDKTKKEGLPEFIKTIGKMEPGQSLFVKELPSNYRVAIYVVGILLNKGFATRLDLGGRRIGCYSLLNSK